jgi:regulator of cell morphogenesis and NO signaling
VLAIDFCCGGTKAISAAAEAAGIEFGELTDLITDDGGTLTPVGTPQGFAERSLTQQVDHLAKNHHRFTRKQLLRLDRGVRRAWSGHRKFKGISRVRALIVELIDDLIPHMAREERYLFPYMRSLEGHSKPGDRVSVPLHGNLEYPLASITHDHTEDSDRLMELRELTTGFDAGSDACGQIKALYAGLADLERDLQEHIRIENQIVFPRALELERRARERATS